MNTVLTDQNSDLFLYQDFPGITKNKRYLGWNSGSRRFSCPVQLNVFLGFGIKFLFTARGTEIIFLSFIFAGELCCFLINGHLADRINCHAFYLSYLPFFASGIYVLSSRERLTTVTELRAIARAANSGLKVKPKEG
jgi:hypothetical protein